MELIIVTGMSGAGKSRTVDVLEDIGYYCVDNMPPALIAKFAEICFQSKGKINKVAIVTDVRGGYLFEELFENLENLKAQGYDYKILFLNASDQSIIKRYKETRRKHPLTSDGQLSVIEAIEKERELLSGAAKRADYTIDTSNLSPQQLREHILSMFVEGKDSNKGLVVEIVSFGYKYGIPLEADLVFDVRFLPNPFYIESLKKFTGLDKKVSDYVYKWEQTLEFDKKLYDMIEYLIPHYIKEGKTSLVIAIGCTGGKHRSVAISEKLCAQLRSLGYYTVIHHRDIGME